MSLPGCDKNMPGSIIAMARLNRPSIMVYGGTIKPGHSQADGSVLDIVSAFQSYGEQQHSRQGDTHSTQQPQQLPALQLLQLPCWQQPGTKANTAGVRCLGLHSSTAAALSYRYTIAQATLPSAKLRDLSSALVCVCAYVLQAPMLLAR